MFLLLTLNKFLNEFQSAIVGFEILISLIFWNSCFLPAAVEIHSPGAPNDLEGVGVVVWVGEDVCVVEDVWEVVWEAVGEDVVDLVGEGENVGVVVADALFCRYWPVMMAPHM
jgi:hypothetical protein